MDIFIAFLDKWQDLIGSIIGGLFTYLAVILTFKMQKKNDYPKKLVTISEMQSEIQIYFENLMRYFVLLNREYNKSQIDTEKLKSEYTKTFGDLLNIYNLKKRLLLQSATIDKKTYRIVMAEWEKFKEKGYDSIGVPSDKHSTKFIMDKCGYFLDDLSEFRKTLSKRIKYYEDRI